jgi:hypothetical protein
MAGEPFATFWTLAHTDGRNASLTCALFSTEHGLEVRCHDGEAVLKTQRVASMADAMNLCEAWKAAYRVQGWSEPPDSRPAKGGAAL